MQIEASDGQNTATSSVKVVVVDDGLDPEPPHFAPYKEEISVTENSPSATIADLGVTASSESFTCDFGFDVTPDILAHFSVLTRIASCAVETTVPLRWTKETPAYRFTVRAINKANKRQWSSAFLIVNVKDENNHAPVFSQQSYAASIYASAGVGTSLMTLKATDKDDKGNGQVKYSLMVNADSPRFVYFLVTYASHFISHSIILRGIAIYHELVFKGPSHKNINYSRILC